MRLSQPQGARRPGPDAGIRAGLGLSSVRDAASHPCGAQPLRSSHDGQPAPRDTRALPDRWRDTLLAARSGAPGPDPLPYAENLLVRWAEPQRRYHTTAHLTAVLDRIDTLAGYAADVHAVRLAAWFHDAVYRPDRTENEERSAALAERALPEAGWRRR